MGTTYAPTDLVFGAGRRRRALREYEAGGEEK
jgi:hypothetical protein